MTTLEFISVTIMVSGAWGWLVGTCAHRWWPVSSPREPAAEGAAARRLTDYDI